jgi:hypothetical protein
MSGLASEGVGDEAAASGLLSKLGRILGGR